MQPGNLEIEKLKLTIEEKQNLIPCIFCISIVVVFRHESPEFFILCEAEACTLAGRKLPDNCGIASGKITLWLQPHYIVVVNR